MKVELYNKTNNKTVKLGTNLPHDIYPAKAIIALYQECWEIELEYREIKSSMLDNAITLRSKTKDLVYQELYGMLLAYNRVRYEIALTANEVGCNPLVSASDQLYGLCYMTTMAWPSAKHCINCQRE